MAKLSAPGYAVLKGHGDLGFIMCDVLTLTGAGVEAAAMTRVATLQANSQQRRAAAVFAPGRAGG
jgi:hypothetical protein